MSELKRRVAIYTCDRCHKQVEWQSHEAAEARTDHRCGVIPNPGYKMGNPDRPGVRPNKYGAVRVEIDGYKFDSKAEAARYEDLKLREKAGELCALDVHPWWDLHVNDIKIGRFTADFKYWVKSQGEQGAGHTVVEDVKSTATRTREFKRTKKHMLAEYGIDIKEVLNR